MAIWHSAAPIFWRWLRGYPNAPAAWPAILRLGTAMRTRNTTTAAALNAHRVAIHSHSATMPASSISASISATVLRGLLNEVFRRAMSLRSCSALRAHPNVAVGRWNPLYRRHLACIGETTGASGTPALPIPSGGASGKDRILDFRCGIPDSKFQVPGSSFRASASLQ